MAEGRSHNAPVSPPDFSLSTEEVHTPLAESRRQCRDTLRILGDNERMDLARVRWFDPAGLMPTRRDLTHDIRIGSVNGRPTRDKRYNGYVLGIVRFVHCT